MYKLTVATPEKLVFEGEVSSLTAAGSTGYLEILTDHAPIITTLVPGTLTIVDAAGEITVYAAASGVLEVSNNVATLLADAMEAPGEINIKRAEAARAQAIKKIEANEEGLDLPRAKLALRRAEIRIRIYHKYQAHDAPQASLRSLF